jgi:saccharopine dehydrogenase-like NADP-dependent oxidoreductase
MQHEKIIVLGDGLVGGPMALDLAAEERWAVTVADVNEATLEELQAKQPKLAVIREDLSNPPKVTELVAGFDIVLNSVPGFMGYATLEAIIEARRNVVDITALWVEVEGRLGGQKVSHTFRMLDRYDSCTGTLSMARTTGYTATAAVRMLLEGLFQEPGIAPPETVGRHKEPFEFMIRCLQERRVFCEEEVTGGTPVLS